MNIYLIPGLGGDKRMYEGAVKKFPNTKVLEFITPKRYEKISDYALRLAEGIDQSQEFILLGVSLGGIMTQEIANQLNPKKCIIISSVKSREELPSWMKFFKYFPIQKIIPGKIYLWAFMFLIWLKNVGSKSNFIMGNLRNMAKDADPRFVYWAVNQVVRWDNPIKDFKPFHIHGNKDFLFPIENIKNVDFLIDKGTHAMILTHVKIINETLLKEIT